MRSARALATAVVVAYACAGGTALAAVAGHSSRAPRNNAFAPKMSVCLKTARTVIAKRLGVKLTDVLQHQRIGSNDEPQCNYLVHRARAERPHTRAVVVVNVDSAPQAAWRLMRKVVEAGQIFGVPPPGWRRPIGLLGLGPDAAWFPTLDQLQANNVNDRYYLTISIVWWRAKPRAMIALARAVTVPYRQVRRFHR